MFLCWGEKQSASFWQMKILTAFSMCNSVSVETAWHGMVYVLQFCFEFYCVSFRLILPIYSFLSYGNRRMKKRKYKISAAQSKFESDLLPKSICLLACCTQCLPSMNGLRSILARLCVCIYYVFVVVFFGACACVFLFDFCIVLCCTFECIEL